MMLTVAQKMGAPSSVVERLSAAASSFRQFEALCRQLVVTKDMVRSIRSTTVAAFERLSEEEPLKSLQQELLGLSPKNTWDMVFDITSVRAGYRAVHKARCRTRVPLLPLSIGVRIVPPLRLQFHAQIRWA